jgi:hypothetical protein
MSWNPPLSMLVARAERISRLLRHDDLTAAERALIEAVADTFFPPDGPLGIGGAETGVADYVARYTADSEPENQRLLRLLFWFTELSPLLLGPRRVRFTRLSHRERMRVLEAAFTSRFYLHRVTFFTLRALATMAYMADPRVLDALGMGFDTDPFGLRASHADEVPAPKESGERLKPGLLPLDPDLLDDVG